MSLMHRAKQVRFCREQLAAGLSEPEVTALVADEFRLSSKTCKLLMRHAQAANSKRLPQCELV